MPSFLGRVMKPRYVRYLVESGRLHYMCWSSKHTLQAMTVHMQGQHKTHIYTYADRATKAKGIKVLTCDETKVCQVPCGIRKTTPDSSITGAYIPMDLACASAKCKTKRSATVRPSNREAEPSYRIRSCSHTKVNT